MQLQKRFPQLFNLVSLGEIASFLNISRRQLHRIRESVQFYNAKLSLTIVLSEYLFSLSYFINFADTTEFIALCRILERL